MNWWWVNHSLTGRQEVANGYLWSPRTNKDLSFNQTYENMALAVTGDVVFSFADSTIGVIGIVTSSASNASKPSEFGSTGKSWAHDGWMLPVEFFALESPLRPRALIDELRPYLPKKYSPIQATGRGNQKFYLTAISEALGLLLLSRSGKVGTDIHQRLAATQSMEERIAQDSILIGYDKGITETEKNQLILARRGQGRFRSAVAAIESCCRVTGIRDSSHLRASHIKPWRFASGTERLDGHNGLFLSPHVDHLFDQGFISFSDSGEMLISPQLPKEILTGWHIEDPVTSTEFTDRQKEYLGFHREHVFRK